MKYSMEAAIEAERLEQQVHQVNYSIVEELKPISFRPDEYVLDAGCGTGVLSRYLVEGKGVAKVDGFDFSDLRVRQARELLGKGSAGKINYFRQDLTQIDPKFHGLYDSVVCRFVIEHVPDPMAILRELRKTLKEGGRLIIIELDGVFINLYSENIRLMKYIEEFKTKSRFDVEIGRKVPSLMKLAGFSGTDWEAKLLTCKGRSLREEHENSEKRFFALSDYLTELLGSKERCEEFRRLYLDEMLKEESTLVFSKYVCTGYKR